MSFILNIAPFDPPEFVETAAQRRKTRVCGRIVEWQGGKNANTAYPLAALPVCPPLSGKDRGGCQNDEFAPLHIKVPNSQPETDRRALEIRLPRTMCDLTRDLTVQTSAAGRGTAVLPYGKERGILNIVGEIARDEAEES